MGHIDISVTLLKQYSLLSLINTYRNVSKYQKHENGHLEKKLRAEYAGVASHILSKSISLHGHASLSCCIPRRSNKMRQDPHKMVKNQHKCFMIFHHGIDSISMDISMHRIEIIEIEKQFINILNREKILNNDIPSISI